jgi:hypothetical protein
MSWFDRFFSGRNSGAAAPSGSEGRLAEWERALQAGGLPSFVESRLREAAAGRAPWLSTMTPVELAMARRHGIRPVAMVSGTCCYHFGQSWTLGHSEGWHLALARLRDEAVAAGANAVVDVKLRTSRLPLRSTMDFTVLGTAVRIDGLPPSDDPVIATVPALEFVRLLQSGIVPTGIAIGAHYNIVSGEKYEMPGRGMINARQGTGQSARQFARQNQPLMDLSEFWEAIRRTAMRELERDTKLQGDGVLAHTHFGQLFKIEKVKAPPQFVGRHIVIGTVVHDRRPGTNAPIELRTVLDMRDDLSPLLAERPHGHNAYPVASEGGPI